MEDTKTPAWFYGPNGQSQIFDDLSKVPSGWQDHPSKVGESKKPYVAPTLTRADDAGNVDTVSTVEADADGHTFDPAMHTGTKTKAGLWRMKVGVARPAPVEVADGAPPLDL